jgi:hypothetical protein
LSAGSLAVPSSPLAGIEKSGASAIVLHVVFTKPSLVVDGMNSSNGFPLLG